MTAEVVAFPKHDPDLVALAIIEGRAADYPRSVIESRAVGDALVKVRREVQLRTVDAAFHVVAQGLQGLRRAMTANPNDADLHASAVRAASPLLPKVLEISAEVRVPQYEALSLDEYRQQRQAGRWGVVDAEVVPDTDWSYLLT